ncbi:unnamed protein product [Ilex paraguariensis]|uniref:Protein LURP-one-related 5-like n=1 Tax=Ilex paraguariensis TaxID=185542 RepID=A0ABC8S2C2_9AQUA
MSKIHPTEIIRCGHNLSSTRKSIGEDVHHDHPSPSVAVLTVWKRSSMSFQGTDGFTVFDPRGRLTFRVENYTRKSRCVAGGSGVVLMDGSGKALLTLKPQTFSMQYQWNGYRGGDECGKSPKRRVFTMRRPSSSVLMIHKRACEAEVFIGESSSSSSTVERDQRRTPADYSIEGSFMRRSCKIKNSSGDVVAKIARKRSVVNTNTTLLLSDDVFSLMVQPVFDLQLIMAFIIILDRICAKPFSPALCS